MKRLETYLFAFAYALLFCLLLFHLHFGVANKGGELLAFRSVLVMSRLSPNDPTSFSRPELVVVKHLKFALEANFQQRIFSGHVELTVEKLDANAKELVLDVKDLHIDSIVDQASGAKLRFKIVLDSQSADIGSVLTIQLPPTGDKFVIKIEYVTSPLASGLQWLLPEQTAGKVHPYVFSQFQAIATRSFIPCQDSPSVKATYEAAITCPSELKVVMSAIPGETINNGATTTYHFKQSVPIQSYLIALAIGALQSRKIGPRSSVHAEKELIDEAAIEFETTETQLKTAEEICGPYLWGIYDLLVLPPSFPFGGMENPCLTFVTPTLLAGDKSLVSVVSHEIAHSWSGNLVTNANFEHFWLNEGFTVFIERKILGRLAGCAVQDFDAYGGLTELRETIQQLGETNPLTSLVVNLTGVHPDDAFSRVPYEKGYIFLRFLEATIGGPSVFEPFLRSYFETYKYKSITSEDFKQYFETYFKANDAIKSIDWNTWLHKPGMPTVLPKYDTTLLDKVEQKKRDYLQWDPSQGKSISFTRDDVSSEEMIQLLQEILESGAQPIEKLERWDEAWKLSTVKNAEIKYRWLRIALHAKWEKMLQPALDWINVVGRMKYTRPIYRDLYDWKEVRDVAIRNFMVNRKYMMHVSASTIAKDLHLN